jgi:hypothetical protein
MVDRGTRMTRALVAVGMAVCLLLLGLVCWVYYSAFPSEADALEVFYAAQVSEDEQLDALIAARGDVVPMVVAAVRHASMPKRRYAVAFLGNSGRRDALPVLRRIVEDETEEAQIRGDALESMARIDLGSVAALTPRYRGRADYLGGSARAIEKGELLPRRERGEAMIARVSVVLGLE